MLQRGDYTHKSKLSLINGRNCSDGKIIETGVRGINTNILYVNRLVIRKNFTHFRFD